MSEWLVLEWREPGWLWLAGQPLVMLALQRWITGRRAPAFADSALLPWLRANPVDTLAWRSALSVMLVFFAWVCLAIAMAGPRKALFELSPEQDMGRETMLVFDLSRSMSATDVAPDRVTRARLEALELLKRLQDQRVGIVVFARAPHLLCPPTADLGAVRHYLSNLRTGLLPTEGTDMQRALAFARAHFTTGSAASQSIVLFTNGMENTGTEQPLQHDTPPADRDTPVYVLGVGTIEGSPLFSETGEWLQYQGEPVVSRLHERQLQQLAARHGGVYARVTGTASHWQRLYRDGIAKRQAASREYSDDSKVIWDEYFSVFVWMAVLAFVFSVLLRRLRLRWPPVLGVVLTSAVCLAAQPVAPAHAEPSQHQRAYQAFEAQRYVEAEKWYAQMQGYAARMGQAGSAYQLGDYTTARQQYQLAVLEADTDDQRADAIFNLGNTYFRLGNYHGAAALFEDVKRYRPADEFAEINRNFSLYMASRTPDDQRPSFRRQGRGPRSIELPEGSEITKGSAVLGDNEPPEQTPPLPPDPTDMQLETLIQRGLAHSQLSDNALQRRADPSWTYKITEPQMINPTQFGASADDTGLWKRLFEIEEGFPAPLEEPREVPGVVPW